MQAQEAEEKSKDAESVTNTQHAGVDEGGIVKVHGNHLVVLRRGRLFTVAIGDGALKPISTVNAFAPDIDPRSTGRGYPEKTHYNRKISRRFTQMNADRDCFSSYPRPSA